MKIKKKIKQLKNKLCDCLKKESEKEKRPKELMVIKTLLFNLKLKLTLLEHQKIKSILNTEKDWVKVKKDLDEILYSDQNKFPQDHKDNIMEYIKCGSVKT